MEEFFTAKTLLSVLTTAGIGASPIGEVLVAVPIGAALGLPIGIALAAAAAGNLAPVIALAAIGERWAARHPNVSGSKRRKRAEDFFERYGVVGLSLLAPILTGVYLSTLVCLYFHVPRAKIITWAAVSIAVWGTAVAVLTAAGIRILAG